METKPAGTDLLNPGGLFYSSFSAFLHTATGTAPGAQDNTAFAISS